MKTTIKSLTAGILAGLACLALCGTARADLSISNSTTTTSWNMYNGQNPFYVSMTSGQMTGFTAQGQPSLNSGATYTVLSETFTITNGGGTLTSVSGNTNYVLNGVAIVGGNQSIGSSIHLYDVTTNLTSNNGSWLNGSGATYNFTLNGDLLGGGLGLSLSNQLSGTDQVLYKLSSGPNTQDQIVLGRGHTYTFEIWTPSAGFSWDRNSTDDVGGQGMGSHDASLGVARLTMANLGLAGGAPRTFTLALYGSATSAAASVNTNISTLALTNYFVDQFNAYGYGPTNYYVGTNNYSIGGITNIWGNWFGSAFSNVVWDSTSDASGNSPNSGSLKITANFPGQFVAFDGFNGITPPLSCYSNGITSFQCDIRFDPSSPTTVNSGSSVTNYGHLQIGTRNGNNQDFWSSVEVPMGTTNWMHVTIPLSLASDPNLFSINDVIFKIDGGWYSSTALSGTSTLWVDNVKFVGPQTVTLPAAPTLSIQPAKPGLRIFAGSSANTYDRAELATIDQNQSWISPNAYPVSYSFTLSDYPANIGQTHIFLVPVNSSGQANMGNQSGSVNEFIEYQASNTLWMVINPGTAGNVTASVQWKTNTPNVNPNITALLITNSTAVGTWTLTFNSASSGTLIAPGASPAAFTIGDPNVSTDFANPLVAYFGLQPNSSAGIGQYEDWASIRVSNVAGANENDVFNADTSINGGLWNINTVTVAAQTSLQLVTTSTPFWVSWTLPAVNYGLGTASGVNGSSLTPDPWMLPEYFNNYGDGNSIPGTANQGNSTWLLVPTTCLPTVDGIPGSMPAPTGFFRLFNPPLSN